MRTKRSNQRSPAPRRVPTLTALVVAAAATMACDREAPLSPPAPAPDSLSPGRSLGLVEVTISGLDAGVPTAGARPYTAVGTAPRFSVDGVGNDDGTGDGTIRLEPVSTGSFTAGERDAGGVRYVYATFRVRNAQEDGTPYDIPRENLTFLAVDTDETHGHTAISRLVTFGGTEIGGATAIAISEALIPTGAVAQDPAGNTVARFPDVLQVLTEFEAALVDTTGTAATDVLPYGFVVRNPEDPASRTLPATPDADSYDGVVTFAFKLPLQPTAAADPFEITAVFLPVDDDETRVTQSLEEQTPTARAAFHARAQALGAMEATLLPGSRYTGPVPGRFLCDAVRVAGPEGAASAVLFPDAPALASRAPDPFAGDGSATRISAGTAFTASFDGPVAGADAMSFVVHGSLSGTAFLSAAYTGGGTSTIGTPAGSFLPGEVVEVALTPRLGHCPAPTGRVARYHVAAAPASGTFAEGGAYGVDSGPYAIAAADLDGDGDVDLATANSNVDNVSVLPGNGDGTFGAAAQYGTGTLPVAIAAADLDGDGDVDLATANELSSDVSVLLNDGNGAFGAAAHYAVGDTPSFVATGDFDGDGDRDLVAANSESASVSVLLNDGDGAYGEAVHYAVGDSPYSVATGDFDGDGDLDLAVANNASDDLSVLLGNGDGTFATAVGYTAGTGPYAIAAGDLDGDGALDLTVTNVGSNTVSVLLGNGDGTFTNDDNYGTFGFSIAQGDLDGDGDLDLAQVNVVELSVKLNDGPGILDATASYDAGDSPTGVAMADLDGDGDLDLAVANLASATVNVMLNAN